MVVHSPAWLVVNANVSKREKVRTLKALYEMAMITDKQLTNLINGLRQARRTGEKRGRRNKGND